MSDKTNLDTTNSNLMDDGFSNFSWAHPFQAVTTAIHRVDSNVSHAVNNAGSSINSAAKKS